MELWDLYDANHLPLGCQAQRGEALPDGALHLVVHVVIFNRAGELLIQLRQPWKDGWPGMWDLSAGGSALCGEDSRAAAEREAAEELGLTLDLSGERPYFTVHFDNGFEDYYLIEREVAPEELHPHPEEVAEVRWASREQVLALVRASLCPIISSIPSLACWGSAERSCSLRSVRPWPDISKEQPCPNPSRAPH